MCGTQKEAQKGKPMSDEAWDDIEIRVAGPPSFEGRAVDHILMMPAESVATIARLLAIGPEVGLREIVAASPSDNWVDCCIEECEAKVTPWEAWDQRGMCTTCHKAAKKFLDDNPVKTWADLEPLGIGVMQTPFDVAIDDLQRHGLKGGD